MSNIMSKYYRYRSAWWRLQRILFPSPAEVRFIELLGGKVYKFPRIVNSNGFCLTIVLSLGKTLKRQNYKREVRYGKYFVDFSNDLGRIIEIDGAAYHTDVLADMEREIYIHGRYPNTRFMRIQAHRLWNDSANVQRKVLAFID